MTRFICIASLLLGTVACDGVQDEGASTGPAPAAASGGEAAGGGAEASAGASFSATLSGAVDRELQGTGVGAGAKWQRYHINMISGGQGPRVVIALHRTDTDTPSSGTYPLGGSEGFRGTVEISGDPEREFEISSGELVITDANGDALTGRFTFTARERTEQFVENPPQVQVEGTFRATPTR